MILELLDWIIIVSFLILFVSIGLIYLLPQKFKKFIIIDDPFTIENEMLTPTMKIRRHQVKKAFGDQLEKLYF